MVVSPSPVVVEAGESVRVNFRITHDPPRSVSVLRITSSDPAVARVSMSEYHEPGESVAWGFVPGLLEDFALIRGVKVGTTTLELELSRYFGYEPPPVQVKVVEPGTVQQRTQQDDSQQSPPPDSEISIADASAAEGAAVVFTVSISPTRSAATTLTYKTADGTAESGDYTGTQTGQVTIPADAASATITVDTAQDSTVEADETFTVTLSDAPAGTTLKAASATGTIDDDDKHQISIADASAEEGDPVSFEVTVSPARSAATVLAYKTSHGTAGAGDYTGTQTGSVTVGAGDTTATITVATADDDDTEADETFTVTISGAPADSEIADATATGTIGDNDPQPQDQQPQDQQPQTPSIAVADAAATEGNPITFTVTISPTRNTATTLAYTIADGLATAADYAGASAGTVTIPANSASISLVIATKDDKLFEASETITLTLSGAPDGTTMADGFAIGTIIDNDNTTSEVTVANGVYNNYHGTREPRTNEAFSGMVGFAVSFSPPARQDAVLTYSTADGTGDERHYFPVADGELHVRQGDKKALITVPVIVGTTASPVPVGTFTVTVGDLPDGFRFASASGSNSGTGSNTNTSHGWKSPHIAPSLENDVRTFFGTVQEGDPFTIVVGRKTTSTEPSRVEVGLEDACCLAISVDIHDADLNPPIYRGRPILSFPANSHWATLDVATYDDHQVEPHERASIPLSNAATRINLGGEAVRLINDDRADFGAIMLSTDAVAMTTSAPGHTKTYTVRLSGPPAPGETLRVKIQAQRDHYIEVYPNLLEFTADDYDSPQTVTIRAFPNWRSPQGATPKPTVLHELIDPNTNLVIGRKVSAVNLASDTAKLPSHGLKRLAIEEIYLARQVIHLNESGTGNSAEYFVRLRKPPAANSVVIAVHNPKPGSLTVSPSSLTFTKENYFEVQRVTVTQVADASSEKIELEHRATGYATVKAVVKTKAKPLGLTFSTSTVSLDESDGTAAEGESFTVQLADDPGQGKTIRVTATKTKGVYFDDGGTAKEEISLSFTGGSGGTWNTAQTVKVFAYHDPDGADDSHMITWRLQDTADNKPRGAVKGVTVEIEDEIVPMIDVSQNTAVALTETGPKVEYCFTPNFSDTHVGNTSFRVDRTPIVITITNSDPGAVSLSRTKVVFSPYDFTKQSPWPDGFKECVDVVAVPDADSANEAVTLSHTVSGYYAVTTTPDITVNVTDDHVLAIAVTPQAIEVHERGAGVEYCFAPSITDQNAQLRSFNEQNRPIAIAITATPSGKVSLSRSTVTFRPYDRTKPSPYAQGFKECVTVRAIADNDSDDEAVTLTHRVSGYFALTTAASVVATVTEETLVYFPKQLRLLEGQVTDTVAVKLSKAPTAGMGNVTVTPTASDSARITTFSPTSLTFTAQNWDTYQTIEVTSADDADANDERLTVTLTSAGGGLSLPPVEVPVIIVDKEPATISISDGSAREAQRARLTISLSALRSEPTTITATFKDGTATWPTDYRRFFRINGKNTASSTTQQLTIPAFTRSIRVDVFLNDCCGREKEEEFTITLSKPPPGITMDKAIATVTIVDR